MKKVVAITDRREAIRTACMMAQKGDVILIAGKGHEDYQEIMGVKHHFDDREVVRDLFAQ
jgi:UDP-N-acetylmuramoyl-L-alanyl-D-glutamate--2,6-diaminopimelate ligase